MSKINKKFETKKTATEMKNFISVEILPSQAFRSFVSSTEWKGNTLVLSSKFGHGTVTVYDYLVEVDIDLNFIGSLSKGAIEAGLNSEFKKLS